MHWRLFCRGKLPLFSPLPAPRPSRHFATFWNSFTMSHQNQTALGESAQNSVNGLKKRSVVSSFIFKLDGTPDGQPKVALFRRSDKVSTYRSAAPLPLNKR